MAEVARVRVELQEQNGRLQAELTALEALKEKAAALERQLKGEGPEQPGPSSRWLGLRAELSLGPSPESCPSVTASGGVARGREAPLPSCWPLSSPLGGGGAAHLVSLRFLPCSDRK